MEKEWIRERYEKLDKDGLLKEKSIQEVKKEDSLKRHQASVDQMTSGIVMAAIGLFFVWFLPASIPLLVIGIPKIVRAAKIRRSTNDEYGEASYRVSLLEKLIEESGVNNEPEEVSGEVV